jgi:hypothetical protein
MSKGTTINWATISILGKNKIVNRSYIYLIIVPILARLLSDLKSPFSYQFTNGYELEIPLELPFNWVLFFFAALCFTIGTIMYTMFAPQIIREDESYGDFDAKIKTSVHIKWYLDDLGISDKYITNLTKIDILKIKQKNLVELAPGEIVKAIADWWVDKNNKEVKRKVNLYYDYWRTQTKIKIPIVKLYWDIYSYSKDTNFTALIISFISYAIGILLIGTVLVQSIKDVILTIIN